MAYASLEPVGNPVDVKDPEKVKKSRRARVEGGLKKLMERNSGG